ncbi:MAG: glycoside hydrolase family 3 N-terminal domain-containing protein [Elusimicrobiaceae bacterium]|jgi:beta-glucosidase
MDRMRIENIIFPAFRFWENDTDYAVRLARAGAGGFCLYGGTPEKIRELVKTVRAINPEILFCADYEDGAGRWVEGCAELPSNMAMGASGKNCAVYDKGYYTALQARNLGVDWVLAPVADLATRPDSPIVNTRAFSAVPEKAGELCLSLVKGLGDGGVLSCVKHFPGHGDTAVDSHMNLPVIHQDLNCLMEREVIPFSATFETVDAVMPGHLLVPALDGKNPASLSREIVSGFLRGKLGFKGCVVTDALSMNALEGGTRCAVDALLAGADILLVPGDPEKLCADLRVYFDEGKIPQEVSARALRNLAHLRRKGALLRENAPALRGDELNGPRVRGFVSSTAEMSCAFAFPDTFKPLERGDSVTFFETGLRKPPFFAGTAQRETANEGDSVFVATLREYGVKVKYISEPLDEPGIFCGVSFSRPRAFSGAINMSEKDSALINTVADRAERFFMVSFGSPFIFKSLSVQPDCGLCAFCALDEYQAFCARVLMGLEKPKGKFEYCL